MHKLEAIQVKITPEVRRLLSRLGPEAVVLIELRYRPAACDSTFCKPIPFVSTRAVGQPPDKGFVKIPTSDVPIFLQEPLAKLAVDRRTRIAVDTTGFWRWRRLRTTGIDPYLI
jgi:hypothetical protein